MKALLSYDQLRSFIPLLRALFTHIEAVRTAAPPGLQIKRLQVPQAVSESIAAHLLSSGHLGVQLQVTASRSGGDLEAATQTGRPAKLEVKATSETAFQQFGEKDLAADVLIWLHFADFLWNPDQDTIWVHFLPKPSAVIPRPAKMPVKLERAKFLELPGVLSKTVNIVELFKLQQDGSPTPTTAQPSSGQPARDHA